MLDLPIMEATLALAFALGCLHALDADHVMAVSALSSGQPDVKSCLKFCGHWATGHGIAMLAITFAVVGLSAAIPTAISQFAEALVGLVLVVIGGWALWQRFRDQPRIKITVNSVNDPANKLSGAANHPATLVGMLHGIAGSAPLLILLPLDTLGSASETLSYVLVFCGGVILAMLIVGGLLGRCYCALQRWGESMLALGRTLVAVSAVGFGLHLLLAIMTA